MSIKNTNIAMIYIMILRDNLNSGLRSESKVEFFLKVYYASEKIKSKIILLFNILGYRLWLCRKEGLRTLNKNKRFII